jgi:nitrogen fixation/metabolism regulation signal transduction histidine kinase
MHSDSWASPADHNRERSHPAADNGAVRGSYFQLKTDRRDNDYKETTLWSRNVVSFCPCRQGSGLLNRDNLFVPFFTTKHGGSGIGLILSRQIAEAHGGVLQLANRSDRTGCEAVLALPITYDGTGG